MTKADLIVLLKDLPDDTEIGCIDSSGLEVILLGGEVRDTKTLEDLREERQFDPFLCVLYPDL